MLFLQLSTLSLRLLLPLASLAPNQATTAAPTVEAATALVLLLLPAPSLAPVHPVLFPLLAPTPSPTPPPQAASPLLMSPSPSTPRANTTVQLLQLARLSLMLRALEWLPALESPRHTQCPARPPQFRPPRLPLSLPAPSQQVRPRLPSALVRSLSPLHLLSRPALVGWVGKYLHGYMLILGSGSLRCMAHGISVVMILNTLD